MCASPFWRLEHRVIGDKVHHPQGFVVGVATDGANLIRQVLLARHRSRV
jgi:hypothetical protein